MSWGGNGVEAVSKNRLKYFAQIGLDPAQAVSAEQVHGTGVKRIKEEDKGKGVVQPQSRISGTDGLVTNVQGVVLTTLHADCAPIFYADERNRATGLAHAGWRGILAGLPGKMLREMEREFGSIPKEIEVAVGPMIGTERYEVTPELAKDFADRFGSKIVMQKEGKPFLDLYAALVHNLLENGLSPERIPPRPPCTFTNSQYPSYRRDGPPARSMLAWMVIS
jgi:hypothetical protein